MDIKNIKKEFPIFESGEFFYLDSAATSQKPRAVIDAVVDCYETKNANIHRGVYELSQRATASYQKSKETLRRFINAKSVSELVYLRGTTEAINLVASSFSQAANFSAGDEIILSEMEHHANIVPWRILADRLDLKIKVIPVSDKGELDLEVFKSLISDKTKLISVVHVSNVLGTINPVKEIVSIAHASGVPVLLDGAQAVCHIPVDVQDLDCDFYVFSGHKTYGPTGIGVLYAKEDILSSMPPYQGGGDMIELVEFEKVTFAEAPKRFEAGTVNLAGALGLGAALEFVEAIGISAIVKHERILKDKAESELRNIPGIKIYGESENKTGVISFTMDQAHSHDVATILDKERLALRAGHHCAQPLMARFGLTATTRASFGIYNTEEDVDALVQGVKKVAEFFTRK